MKSEERKEEQEQTAEKTLVRLVGPNWKHSALSPGATCGWIRLYLPVILMLLDC